MKEQIASLLDSRLCCWLLVNSKCARLECMRVPVVKGKHWVEGVILLVDKTDPIYMVCGDPGFLLKPQVETALPAVFCVESMTVNAVVHTESEACHKQWFRLTATEAILQTID